MTGQLDSPSASSYPKSGMALGGSQHFYSSVENGYRRGFRRFTLSDNPKFALKALRLTKAKQDKGLGVLKEAVDGSSPGKKAVNFLKKARNLHKLKVLAIHFGKVPLRMGQ